MDKLIEEIIKLAETVIAGQDLCKTGAEGGKLRSGDTVFCFNLETLKEIATKAKEQGIKEERERNEKAQTGAQAAKKPIINQ